MIYLMPLMISEMTTLASQSMSRSSEMEAPILLSDTPNFPAFLGSIVWRKFFRSSCTTPARNNRSSVFSPKLGTRPGTLGVKWGEQQTELMLVFSISGKRRRIKLKLSIDGSDADLQRWSWCSRVRLLPTWRGGRTQASRLYRT